MSLVSNSINISNNDDGSMILRITWEKLSNYNLINWRLNRPVDKTRLNEIIYQMRLHKLVDGIIYIVKTGENRYECFDGIHRIEALKRMSKKYDCKNYGILIHYYPEYNEQQIRNRFETLNKCVPVPDVYTSTTRELEKERAVRSVAVELQKRYTKCFSASSRPRVPNENRDNLMNKISDILDIINIYDINIIINMFEQFHDIMRIDVINGIHKITRNQLNKCSRYNCYLFAKKDWCSYFKKLIENGTIIQNN
jgi:hypothetical protein